MIPNLERVIQKLSNPFIKLTEEDKVNLKQIENSVKRDVREFSREAKELYLDQRYLRLKSEFKRIYDQNLQLIIFYDNEDIQKYAMKMRTLQITLRVLKSIFDTPEGFIKKEDELGKEKNV